MENEATTDEVLETAIDDNQDENTNEAVEDISTETVETDEVETVVPEQTEVPVEDDEDDDILGFANQQFTPQGIDLSQLETDEEGNVKPEAFQGAMAQWQQQTIEAAKSQARQETMELRQEERMWQKAFKEFPALKSNKELRKTVQRTRAGYILDGKDATPLEAARDFFKHIQGARATGARQATESVRIQQSAHLETSSTQADQKASKTKALISQVNSRDKRERDSASQALIKQWIENGQIKTS